MEEKENVNPSRIVILFKKEFPVAFLEDELSKGTFIGKEFLVFRELLQKYGGRIEKLFKDIEMQYAEGQDFESYYMVHVPSEAEELRDEILKFIFIDAAYIKSDDEEPEEADF
ncbi:hypothetical protein [Cecembia rubra]|uniref:hypothetical protein n=1 Tax=Cecembia rubra TaxID=1485585 RepID=UPI0027153BFA|nr:hypothetical protein [Cecembia rubra]